jgi:glycosyltransferase
MKISVITTCMNSAATVEDTLNSVRDQSWNSVEHIIIDGGSNDRTMDIVSQYSHTAVVVSEPDDGIYHAMNKGIDLCTGEVVMFLNSDDTYIDNDILASYAEMFESTGSEAAYANLIYVDQQDTSKVTRKWQAGDYNRELFLKGWMPPHPTFAVRKSVLDNFGGFDTRLISAADYELMLRLLFKNRTSCSYIDKTAVAMRAGGVSNRSIKNRIRANREDRLAWKFNGITPGAFTLVRKPLSKVLQYLK